MTERKGQCHCGDIEYSIKHEPINAAYCYCTACQLHTNSDKWYGIWVQEENFNFIKGKPATFTRKGDSGKDMIHNFCSKCGVTLSIFVEIGNFYSVAASTITSGEIPKPNMLIYTKNAASWAQYPKDIPKFEILPPEMM